MLWLAAPLLFLLPSVTAQGGNTLQDCVYCLTDELPNTIACDLETPSCDLTKCGLGTDTIDFEACGCTTCVDPIVQCLDKCTPPCLDTVVEPFVDCMVTPECYEPCVAEQVQQQNQEETEIGAPGVDIQQQQEAILPGVVSFPPLQKPEPCDFLEFIDDPVACLFPIFPACDAVQTDFVDPTCDIVSCCPKCHSEMNDVFNCFYNWASGRDCTFDCPANNGNVRQLREGEEEIVTWAEEDDEESTASSSTEPDMDFIEECRSSIAQDAVESPEDLLGLYMNCVISNTMLQVTSDANKPQETAAPTTSSATASRGFGAISLTIFAGSMILMMVGGRHH